MRFAPAFAGACLLRPTVFAGRGFDNSSTMFLSIFANCLGYQRVNRLRRIFDGAFTTIETDGA